MPRPVDATDLVTNNVTAKIDQLLTAWNIRNTGGDTIVVRLRRGSVTGQILVTAVISSGQSVGDSYNEFPPSLGGSKVYAQLVSGTSFEGVVHGV
jgi:hypothetical protein